MPAHFSRAWSEKEWKKGRHTLKLESQPKKNVIKETRKAYKFPLIFTFVFVFIFMELRARENKKILLLKKLSSQLSNELRRNSSVFSRRTLS